MRPPGRATYLAAMGLDLTTHAAIVLCLALAACPAASDADGPPNAASPGSTTGDAPASSSSEGDPTTSTAPITGTASGPDATTGAADDDGSSGDGSTGAVAVEHCVEHTDKNACEFTPGCTWDAVFSFSRGLNGCQADLVELCVEDAPGPGSTWYREVGSGYQVVGLDNTPDDLPPAWRRCDCDGPVACLCAADPPQCPGRTAEFCDTARTPLGCKNSAIDDEYVCAWANVDPQGPLDDKCTSQSARNLCIPADNSRPAGDCEPLNYNTAYPDVCYVPQLPVFWREHNGVLEISQLCGPVPSDPEWTRCETTDTPEQPDECKCKCT